MVDDLPALWIGFCVIVGATGVAISLRARSSSRPVRTADVIHDDDVVRPCGFKLRRPAGLATSFPFAEVRLRSDAICVRSLGTSRSGSCVERADVRIERRRVWGVQGIRVSGARIEMDLVVSGLPSFIEAVEELGWHVDPTPG